MTTPEFEVVNNHILTAIDQIKWPPGNDSFVIYPESGKKRDMGNGVKPIKDALIHHLRSLGWVLERQRFDAHISFDGDGPLPFVVEWETGNVSSSHRSVNRIALGMMNGEISGGGGGYC
ncbi:MAG: hypothetical protein ACRDNW_19990, partial [Trebonia sp.]